MTEDLIKYREIRFCGLHPDAGQAHSASLLLSDIDGILKAHPLSQQALHVSYDVTRVTLSAIENALGDLGYHLDNSLMFKLKRALYYYTEETQRANLGLREGGGTDMQVFINRYQRLRHGCRDMRPSHWRTYL